MSKNRGLLCFSARWSNPVQWSHYADRHRGICLGFEVRSDLLIPIKYKAKRLAREAEQLLSEGIIDESIMIRFLSTKYVHWKYESEFRCFVALNDKDPENGLHFADFSDDLRLTHVIVGAKCDLSRSDIQDAIGDSGQEVLVFKSRLAFGSFSVVRNRNQSLWTSERNPLHSLSPCFNSPLLLLPRRNLLQQFL